MALVDYYVRIWKNYVKFDGRDSRKQYWMFVLANFIVCFVVGLVLGIISKELSNLVSIIYSLAILCPSIAAGIRRMHDIGKSGWFVLVELIPIAGIIIWIVLAAQPGETSENAYGEVPFDEHADTPI